MAMRLGFKFLLLLSLFAAGGITCVDGQTYTALSDEEYAKLYSLMFPLASEKFKELDSEFAIDVRVRPSFSAPYQISIVKSRHLAIRVTKYEPLDREVSLGHHLSGFLRRGMRDLNVIAESYQIQKREIQLSSKTARAIDEFFKPHRFPKDDRISLDGVGYDIWYVDSASKIELSLTGGEKFEANEPSMITWVRSLAKSVESNSPRSPQVLRVYPNGR